MASSSETSSSIAFFGAAGLAARRTGMSSSRAGSADPEGEGALPHRGQGAPAGAPSAPQKGHWAIETIIPHREHVLLARPRMAQSSKRLEFLQKMTSSGQADSFAWYGLAMEYRSLERTDEALATFESLRDRSPDYVPMYLMCGQMLQGLGRAEDARAWLRAGVKAARAKGDGHAESELQSALDALG